MSPTFELQVASTLANADIMIPISRNAGQDGAGEVSVERRRLDAFDPTRWSRVTGQLDS